MESIGYAFDRTGTRLLISPMPAEMRVSDSGNFRISRWIGFYFFPESRIERWGGQPLPRSFARQGDSVYS